MNSTEIIKKQLEIVPSVLRSYIQSNRWSLGVQEIAQANNFSAEQNIAFENEVFLVLLGLEFRGDFEKNIQASVGLTPELAHTIAQQIAEKVFNEVALSLPQSVEDSSNAPDNLPTGQVGSMGEEKISPNIGTPGEKVAWEQRKQQVADKIVTENKYQNDPYREPLN